MPGNERTYDATDWQRLRAMSDEEAEVLARADDDNPPMDPARAYVLRPRVGVIRRALGLSQSEFSNRYHIPIDTLHDWERGHVEPDQAARAFLHVIATDPEGTAAILATLKVA